jgi:hypothetical protein
VTAVIECATAKRLNARSAGYANLPQRLQQRSSEVERDEVVKCAQAERLDKVAVRAGVHRAALVGVEALT